VDPNFVGFALVVLSVTARVVYVIARAPRGRGD
jgi:hypothetical protein